MLLALILAAAVAALPESTSDASIGWFVGTAAASALAYREISAWVRQAAGKGEQSEITNNPLNVRLQDAYVTRDEFVSMRAELHQMARRLDAIPDTLGAASEDRLLRVHQRIDEMQKEIAQLPAQIITILRNTGNLQ
jgi:hypothetical protein